MFLVDLEDIESLAAEVGGIGNIEIESGEWLTSRRYPFVCLPFVGWCEASHKIFQPKIFFFFLIVALC
jgi:hypothetical protein